jgi:hypothetical protein
MPRLYVHESVLRQIAAGTLALAVCLTLWADLASEKSSAFTSEGTLVLDVSSATEIPRTGMHLNATCGLHNSSKFGSASLHRGMSSGFGDSALLSAASAPEAIPRQSIKEREDAGVALIVDAGEGYESHGKLAGGAATAPLTLSSDYITSMRCPTVYIYDRLPLFKGDIAPARITHDRAFGAALGPPGIYATRQYDTAEIFINRLYRSKHCALTSHPKNADLFFIPAMSAPKAFSYWTTLCRTELMMAEDRAAKALPYLSAATATRHLFIISKSHTGPSSSPFNGSGCAWIRGETPPFDKIQRFAYSHTFRGHSSLSAPQDNSAQAWAAAHDVLGRNSSRNGGSMTRGASDRWSTQLDGRIISIPYPTTVHWSKAVGTGQYWTSNTTRPLLISMICGFHGTQAKLRRRLFKDCNALGPPTCSAIHAFRAVSATALKNSSVFCLEPEGDTPFRKSIYDSLISGCIPVLFSLTTEAVSPWHWGAFRADSRILMSPDDYLSKVVSLDDLRRIPADRIAHMQETIRRHAHKLHYAFEDYPSGDDGFELLLKKALLRAQGVSLADLERY